MSVQPSPRMDPSKRHGVKFLLPTQEYRSQPIPGLDEKAKMGHCFVRVVDLPDELKDFMKVNPRVPSRNQRDLLSGPVCSGILKTLRETPTSMAIKNQGIFLLVEDASFDRSRGGHGELTISLSDSTRHGIVNGGHTYAAIRQAVETADEIEMAELEQAYVRLHILHGIDAERVPEIAEGLNRSKQVDDPSLRNLQKLFQRIKDIMAGRPGEKAIAYKQGDSGDIYISEVLVYLQLFNCARYDAKRHPQQLYRAQSRGLELFEQDLKEVPSPLDLLVPRLPDILVLADRIRKHTPAAGKEAGFEIGRMVLGRGRRVVADGRGRQRRAGTDREAKTPLPFIGETMRHRIPNGWVFPMLAAFRANADWDLVKGRFEWVMPLDELLPKVLPELVGVCVRLHRDGRTPELVGKSESAYHECYREVRMNLALAGLLTS